MQGIAVAEIYRSETEFHRDLGSGVIDFSSANACYRSCSTRSCKTIIHTALKALNCNTIGSKLVWNCMTTLRQVAIDTITLMWVLGHKGIEGRQAVD